MGTLSGKLALSKWIGQWGCLLLVATFYNPSAAANLKKTLRSSITTLGRVVV